MSLPRNPLSAIRRRLLAAADPEVVALVLVVLFGLVLFVAVGSCSGPIGS